VTERQPGSDPIGELQRWLVRSGARSVTRELGDQVRTVLGGSTHGDVWENATAANEAPECQWCPICRARRKFRDSGPGLSSAVAAAGDAVSVVMQDAAAAFEAAVAAAGRQARPRDDAPATGAVWDEATDEPARPRPRVLLDPPARPDEPGGPSSLADPWAQAADQADPSAQAAKTAEPDPGPSTPPSPGEQNPTQR
jgi:xanthine/CO dehydrogenase XdhC/CoxF family maturation factor